MGTVAGLHRTRRPLSISLATPEWKLTVARALAGLENQGRRWKVIDNHYINNVIFNLIEPDGVTVIAREVWERVEEVREAVLRTIEAHSPPELSFVFSNVLIADSPADAQVFRRVVEVAIARQSTFLPVRVTCDINELERRIVNPDRRQGLKWVDGDAIRSFVTSKQLFEVGSHGGFDLDISAMSPRAAATAILDALSHSRAAGFPPVPEGRRSS